MVKQSRSWYLSSESEVLTELKTSLVSGLSNDEAAIRIIRYGPNRIPDIKRKSALRILASQFADLFVIVLILAAILGFYQEYRAE